MSVRELRNPDGSSFEPPLYVNENNELCDENGKPFTMRVAPTTRFVIRAYEWLGRLRKKLKNI